MSTEEKARDHELMELAKQYVTEANERGDTIVPEESFLVGWNTAISFVADERNTCMIKCGDCLPCGNAENFKRNHQYFKD